MSKKKKSFENIETEILQFVKERDEIDVEYQKKLIKEMLQNTDFCVTLLDVIDADFFIGYYKDVIKEFMNYFKKYQKVPTIFALRMTFEDKYKKNNQEVYDAIKVILDEIEQIVIPDNEAVYIREKSLNFFKSQNLRNTIIELARDWKNNDFSQMRQKLEAALILGENRNYGHDYKKDLILRYKRDEREDKIPIMENLDEVIGGGVGKGELFIVLSPTGGGKSMFLVNCAANILKQNKNVIYYSLELNEYYVAKRIDSCLTGLPINSLYHYQNYIKEQIEQYSGHLIVKQYPDGFATINMFLAHMKHVQQVLNINIDCIIVDYADNMKIRNFDPRRELIDIYRQLRSLAVDLNVPLLTATQTNNYGYGTSELELTMTSEAKGKNNIADIIVGFGRDKQQQENNRATIKILKNRSGKSNIILPCYFDPTISLIKVDPSINQQI